MTIDIGTNLEFAIIIASAAALFITMRKRTTPAEAVRATWEAWRAVSERALEKGQPVPPPPGEHGKR